MIVLPAQKDRTLIFSKDVDQETIGDLSKSILEIQDDDAYVSEVYKVHGLTYEPKPIKIYIDSHGGRAYQCLGLLGVIKNSTIPIHTIVTGVAASAGFIISITGHKRFAYKTSTFMYHQIAGCDWGNLKEREDHLMEARRLQKIIEKHTLEHTKISKKRIKEVFEKKIDWYMNAKEALENGVIDGIL